MGRKCLFVSLAVILAIAWLFCLSPAMAKNGGTCVSCHTDPDSLKKEFTIPKIDRSEGEG